MNKLSRALAKIDALSLLAEEAESDRDKWRDDATEIANKCAIDIAALQSRLDAVSALAASIGSNDGYIRDLEKELRAILGS